MRRDCLGPNSHERVLLLLRLRLTCWKKDANASASNLKYFAMWTDGGKEETPSTMCAPE